MEALTWRSFTTDDEPLLIALYTANKAPEFAPLHLSSTQLQPLLEMQYRARAISYQQSYPHAVDMILCLPDGQPVGRHLLARQPDCYHSIDLAILPQFQNRGIGTWALRQVQQIAALESVPLRLHVYKTNPALRLYQRLGFVAASGDELAYEMEWRATDKTQHVPHAPLMAGVPSHLVQDREAVIEKIFTFLRRIGLTVQEGTVPSSGLLPGVQLVANGLRVERDALLYPGDLLHEAGHLAVLSPKQRAAEFPTVNDPAEEMAALAWSYAAALEIGIAPEIVFHDTGYRGQGRALVEGYRHSNAVGLPMLWWLGLTTRPTADVPSIFPRMLDWLRQEQPQNLSTVEAEARQLLSTESMIATESVKEGCNA